MCRTSVHTVSASDSTAVLSSYAPTEDWNLYLQCITVTSRQRYIRHSVYVREFRSIFNGKEVICHRLVRELVNERGDDVHRAVSHNQRRALPPGILFLFPSHTRAHVGLRVLEYECAHIPESLDLRACIHLTPPGPQMPAPVRSPRRPRPRTGALDHHAPGSCASAANSPVGAPLHGYSRADGAHRGARGVRGRNIGCTEIHLTLCTRLRSTCPIPRRAASRV